MLEEGSSSPSAKRISIPMVSVVIPAYQRPDYLNQALESVHCQTFADYEVIVVDDCSGDEFVSQYRLRDGIRLLRHDERRGPAAARNTGIENARGRFIALMDTDDFWLPDKLEMQVRELDYNSDVGLTYCHYVLVNDLLEPLPKQPRPKPLGKDPLRRLLWGNVIKSCSVVLVRREALEKCGLFDESILGVDDWDLWLRVARCYQILQDPTPRVLYRTHPAQFSDDRLMMRQGELAVREQWLEWAERERPDWTRRLRFRMSRDLQRLARCEMRAGLPREAVRTLRRALHVCPWNMQSHAQLLLATVRLTHRILNAKARKIET